VSTIVRVREGAVRSTKNEHPITVQVERTCRRYRASSLWSLRAYRSFLYGSQATTSSICGVRRGYLPRLATCRCVRPDKPIRTLVEFCCGVAAHDDVDLGTIERWGMHANGVRGVRETCQAGPQLGHAVYPSSTWQTLADIRAHVSLYRTGATGVICFDLVLVRGNHREAVIAWAAAVCFLTGACRQFRVRHR